MLNYIWTFLIFLGLAAAISTDVANKFSDRHRNGKSVELIAFFPNQPAIKSGDLLSFQAVMSAQFYNKTYGDSITGDIRFSVKTKYLPNQWTSAVLLIPENAPLVIKEIAKSTGEDNDIVAKLSYVPGGITGINVVFEEVNYYKMKEVTNSALGYADTAVTIAIGLIGIMAMWLGIMKIAEESGVINSFARLLRPVTRFLFPDVPHDHPAIGSIVMNLAATILGLGNAATPLGIKAMEDLNSLNPDKGVATNAMCTFLVLNTASFALMPTTAIALRAAAGSPKPAIIIGTTMFGSFIATMVGIIAVKVFEKFSGNKETPGNEIKNKLRVKKIIITVAAIASFLVLYLIGFFRLLGSLFSFMSFDFLRTGIEIISTLAIPSMIVGFVALGFWKKVKVYETFIEGAKEGFNVAVMIIPYLVAILMAIGIFRSGGAMNWLVQILAPVTDLIGMPAEALPMALMRPLSGSGSLGIMAEIIAVHGPDSFIGILVSTMYGSTETTFFVLAVYFGAVNVKNTRHALPAGLISDLAGLLAALLIVRLLYPAGL
ncbi:MAG TPA: nucleoside recognition domain-containing protein [Ignavibacteriaceae bacterium]|nr:nucleoside recognition domain-containing protein [Ignavibacteriaceae bacterium]